MEQFSGISPSDVFTTVRTYCSWSKRGPLGDSEVGVKDDNGDERDFIFESFHNGHEALTLAVYSKVPAIVVVPSASAVRRAGGLQES